MEKVTNNQNYNYPMYSIVIQAGGMSSRMGRDKSFIDLCGKTMIQFVIDRMSVMGEDLIITTKETHKFDGYAARTVSDEFLDVGALAGLHAGIKAAKNDLVIVVANDMPFVSIELLRYMQGIIHPDVDVVIPVTARGYEPFHAIYRKSTCLPAIESAIFNQKRRVISWFDQVNVISVGSEVIDNLDPKGYAFFNVNTPEEFIQAAGILKKE